MTSVLKPLLFLFALLATFVLSVPCTLAQGDAQRQMELARQIQELMEAGKQEEAMKLYEQMMRQSFSGKVRLAGIIVDGQGKPLDDVVMEIVTLEYDSLQSTDLKESSREQPVNGSFEYACDACAGVRLEFNKDGYYRERVEYVTYADDNPNREIIKTDEKVVLEKRGVRVALEHYRGMLIVSQDRNEVLPLSFGQTSRAEPISRLTETATLRKFDGDILYLELKVKKTANGEIATQEVRRPGTSSSFRKPVEPILDFGPADGGVILFQPQSRYVRKIDLEMKRAPVDGYQPTLALDLETDDTQYFFCRIGKRYCRGSVNPVSVNRSSNGQYAGAHVSIRLNPTAGDTNLEQ